MVAGYENSRHAVDLGDVASDLSVPIEMVRDVCKQLLQAQLIEYPSKDFVKVSRELWELLDEHDHPQRPDFIAEAERGFRSSRWSVLIKVIFFVVTFFASIAAIIAVILQVWT